jgi:hypothetical protein
MEENIIFFYPREGRGSPNFFVCAKFHNPGTIPSERRTPRNFSHTKIKEKQQAGAKYMNNGYGFGLVAPEDNNSKAN